MLSFRNKFAGMLLMPVVLLGHLLCVCPEMHAVKPVAEFDSAIHSGHFCCGHSRPVPVQDKQLPEHHSGCTHCGNASAYAKPADRDPTIHPPQLSWWLGAMLASNDAVERQSGHHHKSRPDCFRDLSPPADPLDMKCCLQI